MEKKPMRMMMYRPLWFGGSVGWPSLQQPQTGRQPTHKKKVEVISSRPDLASFFSLRIM